MPHKVVTAAAAADDDGGGVDAVKDGSGRGAWKARNGRTMAGTSFYDDRRCSQFPAMLPYACHYLHW